MTIPCTPRRRLEEAAPLLHSNGRAVPPTSAPFLDHVRPEAGAVLSPSQANTWLSCPARWMFKNLLELPDPQNAARFVGSCVHKSLEGADRAAADGGGRRDARLRSRMGGQRGDGRVDGGR